MKYFKDAAGAVFAYESDGSQDHLIGIDLQEISEQEARQIAAAGMAIPQRCTRRQGLLALLAFGIKRADIEVQIAAIEDEIEREEAQIEYEASEWEIANSRLQQMWAALGGAPAQLVDVFRLAVTL